MDLQEATRYCDEINGRIVRPKGQLPYPRWFYTRQMPVQFRAPGTSWYCVNSPELAGEKVTVLSYPYIVPGYYPHYDVLAARYTPAPSWGVDVQRADGTVVKAYAGSLWDHIPW